MSKFFRTLCCVPWVIPTCFFLGVDIFVVLAFVSPPQADPSNEKLIIPRGKLWGQICCSPQVWHGCVCHPQPPWGNASRQISAGAAVTWLSQKKRINTYI